MVAPTLLLIALGSGLWMPAAVGLAALTVAATRITRRSTTALLSADEFVLVRNSRRSQRPQIDERVVRLPITAVNIQVDREFVGSIRVVVNGTRYWALGGHSDDVRKLIRELPPTSDNKE